MLPPAATANVANDTLLPVDAAALAPPVAPPVAPQASTSVDQQLQETLPRHGPFFVTNGACTTLLTAVIVFGIKGLIVWGYHTSVAVPRVSTADVASMWTLLLGACAFFVVTVLLIAVDAPVGWHVDHLNAYLFAVTGLLLHACTVFASCAGAGRTVVFIRHALHCLN